MAATTGSGEVKPLLPESSTARTVMAWIAAKKEGGLKAELDAVKERLRLAEEQLRCAKILAAIY